VIGFAARLIAQRTAVIEVAVYSLQALEQASGLEMIDLKVLVCRIVSLVDQAISATALEIHSQAIFVPARSLSVRWSLFAMESRHSVISSFS
jgi:hypothetical protein